jgi:hypothetical protein
MEQTQAELRQKLNAAVLELAAMLDPKVFAMWQAESDRFNAAQERGEFYPMTPLAQALNGAAYQRATTGQELFFPPGAAAMYHRAPKAAQN